MNYITVNCINCTKSFEKSKTELQKNPNSFCSRSCSNSYHNRKSPKRKPMWKNKKCLHCDSFVRNVRSKLCEFHFQKLNSQDHTVGFYREKASLKGLHRSSLHAHVRALARNSLKHLKNENCRNCDYSKHVELCHIKPISSFGDDALIKDINSERNVVPLCPNCHWETHNGYLDIGTVGIEPTYSSYTINDRLEGGCDTSP